VSENSENTVSFNGIFFLKYMEGHAARSIKPREFYAITNMSACVSDMLPNRVKREKKIARLNQGSAIQFCILTFIEGILSQNNNVEIRRNLSISIPNMT
jgi:hypothetical protein